MGKRSDPELQSHSDSDETPRNRQRMDRKRYKSKSFNWIDRWKMNSKETQKYREKGKECFSDSFKKRNFHSSFLIGQSLIDDSLTTMWLELCKRKGTPLNFFPKGSQKLNRLRNLGLINQEDQGIIWELLQDRNNLTHYSIYNLEFFQDVEMSKFNETFEFLEDVESRLMEGGV